MPRTLPRLIVILAVAGSTIAAAPGSAAPPPHRNAATRYERAFEHMEKFSDADWELIWAFYDNPAATPSPKLGRIRARVKRTVDAAVRGSRLPVADYELDWDAGYMMQLPHLAPMRRLGYLMRHDVIMHLHEGDAPGAADRLAAMYRMSHHPPDDGTMISSLVGMAMFDLADMTADIAMAQGLLGEREYGILFDATEAFGGDDPFRFQSAVAGEREMGGDWLHSFSAEGERGELLKALGWSEDDAHAGTLVEMTEQEFTQQLGVYDATLARIEAAFGDPDREAGRATLEAIDAELENSELGPLVAMLLPAHSRAFDRNVAMQQRIALRRQQFHDLATGRRDHRELVNAAFLYQRATEAIARLDPDDLAALRAQARGAEADAKVIRRGLDAAAPILDLLDEASRYERCDFSALRPEHDAGRLFATPIAGLADAGALMLADAITRPDENRDGANPGPAPSVALRNASRRFATCLRMASHLAGDDALLSALVAQDLLTRTVDLAVERVEREEAAALVEATARLRPADPFGYRVARAAAVEGVNRWVAQRVPPPPAPTVRPPTTTQPAESPEAAAVAASEAERTEQFYAALKAKVEALDADELFCLMAVREHRAVVAPQKWGMQAAAGDPLLPLADLIDRAGYAVITERAEAIEALVAANAITLMFSAEPAPKAARVTERMARAAPDLRAGLGRLRERAGTPAAETAFPAPGATRDRARTGAR